MARVVVHERNIALIDATPLMGRLARAVRDDAQRIVPVRTGFLRSTIAVTHISRSRAEIAAGAHYAGYVELGTRYMRAQPYLRPALYRLRSPGNTPR